MKKILSLVVALALCISCLGSMALAEEAPASTYQLGDTVADFTANLSDGTTVTLSELLSTHEVVLINFWATWCSPCRGEFPFMQEAYDMYSDKVAIVALSIEPTDTVDVINDFKPENGLTTLPMGHDDNNLGDMFSFDGIPTSIIVDRFGVVCWQESGSITSTDTFCRLFEGFLGDDYTESKTDYEIPPVIPTIAAIDPAELAAAANAEGQDLVWSNEEDQYAWPWIVTEKDGRTCIAASNTAVDDTYSGVNVTFTAAAGDVLTFDFKASTEATYDLFSISVNGEEVKAYSGERDWSSYAYQFTEAGDYTVNFSFAKDMMEGAGDDCVYMSNVAVVSGDAAAAALAAVPVYPVAEKNELVCISDDAKEIVFDDPSETFTYAFGEGARFYIAGSDTVEFIVKADADTDPDSAYVIVGYDNSSVLLYNAEQRDGGYYVASGVDSMEKTGYSYSVLQYLPGNNGYECAVLFASEENVNTIIVVDAGITDGSTTWTYADGTAPSTDALAEMGEDVETGYASYVLNFVDQNGDAVPDLIVNVCDDTSCVPMTTDENGVAAFDADPFAYHLQVLKVPEGYSFDTTQELYTEEASQELTFTVTKN